MNVNFTPSLLPVTGTGVSALPAPILKNESAARDIPDSYVSAQEGMGETASARCEKGKASAAGSSIKAPASQSSPSQIWVTNAQGRASAGAYNPELHRVSADSIVGYFQNMADHGVWGRIDSKTFIITTQETKPFCEADLKDAQKRGEALAGDPAHGGKITKGSREEAAVALMADRYNVLEGPLTREKTGTAEFVDGAGRLWDVKSPLSPPEGQNWVYDAEHQVMKVHHEVDQGQGVLLNLTKCNSDDTKQTLDLMIRELSEEEKSRVLVLVDKEDLTW